MLKNRISAYRNERQNRKTENRNAPLRYGRFTTTSTSKYEHFTHKSAFFLVILYDLRSLSLWGWGKYCILIDRTTRGREKIDLVPKSSAAVSSLIVQSIALEMHVENARFQRNAREVLELRHVPGCPIF